MANNPDFKKIVLRDVEFAWPRLDQPYRYDPQEERTEACAPGAVGAGWSVSFSLPTAEGKALFTELKDHYNECRSRNGKLPQFSGVFSMKKNEDDGTVMFTAKKRAMSNDGKENKPPRVVGADLKDLEDKAIWTGSRGSIRVLAFASTNPQDKSGGISLLLDTVQVIEPVYGSDNLEDDFGPAQPADIDSVSGDSDFSAPASKQAKASVPVDAEF